MDDMCIGLEQTYNFYMGKLYSGSYIINGVR